MANFQIIRETQDNLEASNPILAPNQLAVFLDVRNGVPTGTNNAKLGNGRTRFNDLDYWSPNTSAFLSAYVVDAETRDTELPSIDDYLVFDVEVGQYFISGNLFWDFDSDSAVISLNGGTATVVGIIQWIGFPTTDITTPAFLFTEQMSNVATALSFGTNAAGAVTTTMTGMIDVTVAGTFALKWGGTNGGANNQLLQYSSITLTKKI